MHKPGSLRGFLVAGPYATRIFVDELGAPASSVVNNTPLEDFGGQFLQPCP